MKFFKRWFPLLCLVNAVDLSAQNREYWMPLYESNPWNIVEFNAQFRKLYKDADEIQQVEIRQYTAGQDGEESGQVPEKWEQLTANPNYGCYIYKFDDAGRITSWSGRENPKLGISQQSREGSDIRVSYNEVGLPDTVYYPSDNSYIAAFWNGQGKTDSVAWYRNNHLIEKKYFSWRDTLLLKVELDGFGAERIPLIQNQYDRNGNLIREVHWGIAQIFSGTAVYDTSGLTAIEYDSLNREVSRKMWIAMTPDAAEPLKPTDLPVAYSLQLHHQHWCRYGDNGKIKEHIFIFKTGPEVRRMHEYNRAGEEKMAYDFEDGKLVRVTDFLKNKQDFADEDGVQHIYQKPGMKSYLEMFQIKERDAHRNPLIITENGPPEGPKRVCSLIRLYQFRTVYRDGK